MQQHYLANEQISAFASSLVRAERTPATIENTSEAYGLSSCTWMGGLLPRTLS